MELEFCESGSWELFKCGDEEYKRITSDINGGSVIADRWERFESEGFCAMWVKIDDHDPELARELEAEWRRSHMIV